MSTGTTTKLKPSINSKSTKDVEVVKHPYQLTANFVKWKFTPGENRILIRILQRIKVNQDRNISPQINFEQQITLKFHYRDLMLEGVNDTNKLRKNIQNLREKSLYIPYTKKDGKGVEQEKVRLTGVITEADYDLGSSEVVFYLNVKWYNFLLDVRSHTKYLAPVAYKLNTSYSIKMYYFVCHWFNNKGHKLTLEQLRKEFDIPEDQYRTKTASRFKERILKPSKELLDKVADRSFNFTEIKEGRSIIGFSFIFYETKNVKASLIDWHDVNKFLDSINDDFPINKTQRARIAGLIKKFSFPIVKHFFRMQKHIILDYVNQNMTVVDAIAKGLKKYNIDPIQQD